VDAQSAVELWALKVWDVCYGDMQPDCEYLFVISLGLSANDKLLLVEGENGEQAAVDLASRELVSRPSGPQSAAGNAQPAIACAVPSSSP
jgi:hypothetical protein